MDGSGEAKKWQAHWPSAPQAPWSSNFVIAAVRNLAYGGSRTWIAEFSWCLDLMFVGSIKARCCFKRQSALPLRRLFIFDLVRGP